MTCASTNLAMRIEIALNLSTTPRKQLAARTQIFAELEYLRESCEYWNSLVWTVRMLEAVVARTKLGLAPVSRNDEERSRSQVDSTAGHLGAKTNEDGPRSGEQHPEQPHDTLGHDDNHAGARYRSAAYHPAHGRPPTVNVGIEPHDTGDPLSADYLSGLPPLDEGVFGVLPVLDGYDWLQDSSDIMGHPMSDQDFLEPLNGAGLL